MSLCCYYLMPSEPISVQLQSLSGLSSLSTLSEGGTGKINLLTTCRHLTLSVTKVFLLSSSTITPCFHSGNYFTSNICSLASLALIIAISLLQCHYHLPYRITQVAPPWNILTGSSITSWIKNPHSKWVSSHSNDMVQ